MSVYAIIGNPKCGKTLFMRALMMYSKYDNLYCNIKLKKCKYTMLQTSRDITHLPKNNLTKGVFIDELHQMGADSWGYDKLAEIVANFGTQHRKFHCDIIFTTQHLNQVINRIRNIVSGIYKPHDICFIDGRPYAVKVMELDFNLYGDAFIKKDYWFPLFKIYNGKKLFACDLYDTYEFVEAMEPIAKTIGEDMIIKYKDFPLLGEDKNGNPKTIPEKMRDLKSILIMDEEIPQTLATQIANRLAYEQKLCICA